MTALNRSHKDSNHGRLRGAWIGLHGSWLDLVPIEPGTPDALLGLNGIDQLVEIKDGDKPPSGRRLSERQVSWHRVWRGRPVRVVETMAHLLALRREMSR